MKRKRNNLDYKVLLIKDRKELIEMHNKITRESYPEFMLHDPISNNYWTDLFKVFPDFQFLLMLNNDIVGAANSIPFYWNKILEELPEEGWDWVLKKGFLDKSKNRKPNMLSGLQIVIRDEFRGKGISYIIIREMIRIARNKGFQYLIIPVRPSQKSKYPKISIEEYIRWKRTDKLPFDPWIRVHVKLGGKVIKPCHRAMYISGSISDWENWTGLKFPKKGEYLIEGALTPIKIDYSKNIGEYIEPNVWIAHEIIQFT